VNTNQDRQAGTVAAVTVDLVWVFNQVDLVQPQTSASCRLVASLKLPMQQTTGNVAHACDLHTHRLLAAAAKVVQPCQSCGRQHQLLCLSCMSYSWL
jgi:hypothetical protein